MNDGGPAFPRPYSQFNGTNAHEFYNHQDGMTLRDYFAAKALAAIVARARLNPCGDFVAGDCLLQSYNAPECAAKTAYAFADAMIKAREEKKS